MAADEEAVAEKAVTSQQPEARRGLLCEDIILRPTLMRNRILGELNLFPLCVLDFRAVGSTRLITMEHLSGQKSKHVR